MLALKFRLGDLISFELAFVLFLLAPMYKSSPSMEQMQSSFDLTLAMAIISMLLGLSRLVRLGISYTSTTIKYFVIWGLLLLFISVSYATTKPSDYAYFKLLKVAFFTNWAIIAPLFIFTTKEHFGRFIRFMLVFTVCNAIYTPLFGTKLTRYLGYTSFGGGSYQWLGITVATGFAIAVVVMLFTRSYAEKVVMGMMAAITFFSFLLSGLRQGVVALFAVGVFVLFAVKRGRELILHVVRFSVVLLVIAVIVIGVNNYFSEQVDSERSFRRLAVLFQENQWEIVESSHRPTLWLEGLQIWLWNPLLGVGFGAYPEHSLYTYPHNYFIELLAELGVIGFLLGVPLMWMPFRAIIRQRKIEMDWITTCLGVMWVLWFVRIMVSGDLTVDRTALCFAALVVSYISRLPDNTPPTSEETAVGSAT